MKTQIFNEENDLPKVPFFIMVVMEDGKEKPFYVARVGRGGITGATMMNGEFLEEVIKDPTTINCLKPDCTSNERLYIQNENSKGKNKGVDHYRKMTKKETKMWKEKLQPLLGTDIFQQHVESYEKQNKDAKEILSSLNNMLV